MKPSEHGNLNGGELPKGDQPSVVRRNISGEFTSEVQTVPVLRTAPVRRSVNVRRTPGGSLTSAALQLRSRGTDQSLTTRGTLDGARRRDGAFAERPRLTSRDRVLARHPGMSHISIDKLISAGEILASRSQQSFRTLVANPYSSEARQAFAEYSPRIAYSPTIVRAVILAEPQGERDRQIRQLPREDRLKVKRNEIDDSADIVVSLTKFVEGRSVRKHEFGDLTPAQVAARRQDKFWQLPPEGQYEELIRVAFGKIDQAELERQYSRELRRGVKIGISNFIEGQRVLTPYKDQITTDVSGVVQSLFKRSATMPLHGEVTPYGLMIYFGHQDYRTMVRGTSAGAVLSLESAPHLHDRMGVVNRGGNGFEPIGLRDLRAHEGLHMLFAHAFQGRESLLEAKEVVKRMREVHDKTPQREQGQPLDVQGYQRHARELQEQFTDRAKNEAIAYLFGNGKVNEYYFHPIDNLGGKYFLNYLEAIKTHLNGIDGNVMPAEEKAAVYGVYKNAFADYLGQVRVYQWLAANLRRQQTRWTTAKMNGEPVVGEQILESKAAALLQVVPFEQARLLGRYIGIEPSGIDQAFQENQAQLVASFTAQLDGTISYFTMYEIKNMYPVEALPAFLQVIGGTKDGGVFSFKDVLSSIKATELILHMHHDTMTQDELLAVRKALGAVASRDTMFRFQDDDFAAAKKRAEVLSDKIIDEYILGDEFGFAVTQAIQRPKGEDPTIGQLKELVALLEGKRSFAWAHHFHHEYYDILGQQPEGIPVLITIANTAVSTAFISSAIDVIAKQYDRLTPELKADTTVMLFDVLRKISQDTSNADSSLQAMILDLLARLKQDM